MAVRLLDQVNVSVSICQHHTPIRVPSSATRTVWELGKNSLAISSADRPSGTVDVEFFDSGRVIPVHSYEPRQHGRRHSFEIKPLK
jgi:DUF4097 and DUF4098 domain-containing protein YvlB